MVDIASLHPRLNLLNLEAVAAAGLFAGSVWLSVETTQGILPAVLDAEGLTWKTVVVE